jgi:hypothetical protein
VRGPQDEVKHLARQSLPGLFDRPGYGHGHLERLFALCHRRCRGHPGGHPAIGDRDGRTPLRDAERRAERDAGGLGVNLGLAPGIGDRLFAGVIEQFRRL